MTSKVHFGRIGPFFSCIATYTFFNFWNTSALRIRIFHQAGNVEFCSLIVSGISRISMGFIVPRLEKRMNNRWIWIRNHIRCTLPFQASPFHESVRQATVLVSNFDYIVSNVSGKTHALHVSCSFDNISLMARKAVFRFIEMFILNT